MIISLDDCAFTNGINADVVGAIELALRAFQLGQNGLVVSPAGFRAALESNLNERLKAEIALVHRNWIEGHGLARRARRVAAITGEASDHGKIVGNTFYVYAGQLETLGLTREPSHVVESLTADDAYLRLLMRIALDMNDVEMRRFWYSRPEQGGGGAVRAYVDRYVHHPSPVFVLCDRDGPDENACGSTAQGCIDALLTHAIFPDAASALAGGFSPLVPSFGFRVIAAHEMENLILPRIAAIYLDQIIQPYRSLARLTALRAVFPNFPDLTNEESYSWTSLDFKNFPGFGQMFGSESLREIVHWTQLRRENFEAIRAAARQDFSLPRFFLAVNEVVLDVWTTGACQRALF